MFTRNQFLALLITNVLTATIIIGTVLGTQYLMLQEIHSEYPSLFFEQKGKIYVAIVVESNSLFDDEEKNINYARTLVATRSDVTVAYYKKLDKPLYYDCQIFVFEISPKTESVVLK